MNRSKLIILLVVIFGSVSFASGIQDTGERNDNIVDMVIEPTQVVVPAWAAVSIEFIGSVLPGIELLALLALLAHLARGGASQKPNIIGGVDDEEES